MIEVKGITKHYGRNTAVHDVSFTISQEGTIGFLGPNGAGKSTIMNIITGYVSASEGSVRVNGLDVVEHPLEVKRTIGYLPEQPPLYSEMTVDEYIRFVSEAKGLRRSELKLQSEWAMERVRIKDVKKRLIKNLSKGYKQRVGLAQAIVGNPSILILDEPTVGLDPKQITEIRDLIAELSAGRTIILSTHLLAEAQAVCSQVMIMNKGRIIAVDAPRNLANRLRTVNRLFMRIGAGPEAIAASLKSVAAVKSFDIRQSHEEGAHDITLETETGIDMRGEICFALCAHGCNILLMQPEDMSLEQVFLQLTDE